MGILRRIFGRSYSNYNIRELEKIESAIQDDLSTQAMVVQLVGGAHRTIQSAEGLGEVECRKKLVEFLNVVTGIRKAAVRDGARGHGDPRWAPPAVVESWLQTLLLGHDEELPRVEEIVSRMGGIDVSQRAGR